MSNITRREFLKFIGVTALTPYLGACGLISNNQPKLLSKESNFNFSPLPPSTADELLLPEGFSYNLIRSWGDELGSKEVMGDNNLFGYNNDFTCFMPLEGAADEGLLWVNHETYSPFYIRNLEDQKKSVGGSIFRIKKDSEGKWQYTDDPSHNRRIDAYTPMEMTGPVSLKYSQVNGTYANCSGGQTPWQTVLTAEENYDRFPWANLNLDHYGWIVEIDPYDKNSTPRKHTALGKFAHENATVAIGKSGKIVVYMADDAENQFLYKFISKNKYDPKKSREENMKLLEEGELYVVELDQPQHFARKLAKEKDPERIKQIKKRNTGYAKWLHLSVENKKLKGRFKDQADLLLNTRKAAKLVGATPLARPEDIEVSPYDRSIYVAFTKNKSRKNYSGSIMKITEASHDHESLEFVFRTVVVGGELAGMACPDNLAFDNKGNLWIATDISTKDLNRGRYSYHGNNSLFVMPLYGEEAGQIKRFATGPVGVELTGISFSPDFQTLFVSVQHPGEAGLPSKWPHDGSNIPKPSVVAINCF